MKKMPVAGPAGRTFELETWPTPLSEECFVEIMNGLCYPLYKRPAEVQSVVDVGANVGAASVYFAWAYPQAIVRAFEPSPASFEVLRRNLEAAEVAGRVVPSRVAVSNADGTAPFWIGTASEYDGLQRTTLSSGQAVEVETVRLSSVLKAHRPDVLKFDAEGAEERAFPEAFANAPAELAAVRWIHVECHGQARRKRVEDCLWSTHALAYCRAVLPDLTEFAYLRRDLID